MEVRIEFIPNTNSKIEFAEQVKNISKDLIEICARNGVDDLTYVHDYFKIHIKNPPLIIAQDDLLNLAQCEGEKYVKD